jgi:transposase
MRKKVIELIKSGKKQTDIYKFLNLSKSAVIRWYRRYKETGNADYIVNKKSSQSNIVISSKFCTAKNLCFSLPYKVFL